MRIKLLSATLLSGAFLISGCASMPDAMNKFSGVGKVTTEKSSFDQSEIIKMAPAWLYDPEGSWFGEPVRLGAAWSKADPDTMLLIPSYSSDTAGTTYSGKSLYANFTSIDVNIEGEISSYPAVTHTAHQNSGYNTVTRTVYTESRGAVAVPYSLFERMMTAKDVRLRINSSNGSVTAHFHIERIPGGQSTAILHFREMMAEITKRKG